MQGGAETGGIPQTRARFRDRREAGQYLAGELRSYHGRPDLIVLALPRGGLPVAAEVARGLGAPLDIYLVRKVGLPGHEEFAMGAIASGGTVMINDDVIRTYRVSDQAVQAAVQKEQHELERREQRYRGARPQPQLGGKVVVLIDDGLATGSSMRAAVEAVRRHSPREIIVAVPVAPAETCEALAAEVDHVFCGLTPDPFYAVGLWYEDFSQTTDDEVTAILNSAGRESTQ